MHLSGHQFLLFAWQGRRSALRVSGQTCQGHQRICKFDDILVCLADLLCISFYVLPVSFNIRSIKFDLLRIIFDQSINLIETFFQLFDIHRKFRLVFNGELHLQFHFFIVHKNCSSREAL